MSEMVERAAKAVYPLVNVDWDDARGVARAALLAALDPEDQALVEIMARAAVVELAEGMPAPKTLHRLDVVAARASLVALRDSIRSPQADATP